MGDPQQVQKITGRPTSDRHDCQWIQRLHTCGLLAGAVRPADQVCVRRSSLRQRAMLRTHAAQHIQPMQKALTQMHIMLQHVVSDMTGGTGLAIIRAIVAGERDPAQLAQRRNYRCQHDEATIARTVQGNWRDEHLCALAQAVALSDVSQQKITACDQLIEASLQTFAAQSDGQPFPPPSRPRKRGGNPPACAVRQPLHRISGGDLPQLEGLDETTALIVLSEIGLDMRRWPTVKHFTSWVGLCPHHRVSGGKVLSRRTKPCANQAAPALRRAAACLHHSQSALGSLLPPDEGPAGRPKAMTATAHKLARLIYTMLKQGAASVRQGMDAYAQQYRERAVKQMTRRAKALGYLLVKAPEGVPA